MKVSVTFYGCFENLIIDFPFIPKKDTQIIFSAEDIFKIKKIIENKFMQIEELKEASVKERNDFINFFCEEMRVDEIRIRWIEEENKYLPEIELSIQNPDLFENDTPKEEEDEFEETYSKLLEGRKHHLS